MQIHTFDKKAEYNVLWRKLPHWSQSGCVAFITFRTNDSIPASVVKQWQIDRRVWLGRHGINPTAENWKEQLESLDPKLVKEFTRQFAARWHDELDKCHGACVLKRPNVADITEDSLHHFDGERYEMLDFVIMPNHVHLLATFVAEDTLVTQCESWKHWMATKINREIGGKGRFWQQDAFDHLVRSEDMFWYFRRYIADNPSRSSLRPGEFRWYSRDLGENTLRVVK